MLLLITGSIDGTSDLIIGRLDKRVFRLNFDLFRDYDLSFTTSGWRIKNPAGHSISSETVTSVFWWKAFNYYLLEEDKFVAEEVKYLFRELYNWACLRKISKGTPPDFHNRLGKINILEISSKYFRTPKSLATFKLLGIDDLKGQSIVAKSFSSGLTVTNRSLMTTEVDPTLLDPSFPWFLQEKLDSPADVTVFVCGEGIYSYERDRSTLKGLDWRPEQTRDPLVKEWIRFNLTPCESSAIRCFCRDIGVEWGRIDFMRIGDELVFLEYNANGQWVFLDYSGEDGLVEAVCKYLYQTE